MKNAKRNSLIILVITVAILYYILKDNYQEIMNVLRGANIWWLLLTILVYIIYFLFDQLALFNITKEYKKDISFKFIVYLGVITKFFNGITPLASGGQPMQVYELHKKDISVGNGTNIVIQNYIVFQIALVFWGILAIVLNQVYHLFAKIALLQTLTIVGFTLNFIILVVLFLISFSKDFNRVIVRFVINILSKLRIVKNREKQLDKWDKTCDEYYQNAQILIKNKGVLISGVVYQIISLTLYYFIPYFLAYAIGCGDNLTIMATLAAGSYIYIMGCYVPIPGASGGMEYGFLGFFGNFITGNPLAALLLIWRFATYYLPTIIGAVVFNIGQGSKEKTLEK